MTVRRDGQFDIDPRSMILIENIPLIASAVRSEISGGKIFTHPKLGLGL